MKEKIEDTQVPIYSWCVPIEEEAKQQIRNAANIPGAFHHVAIMPDGHVGNGFPIGGVLATYDRILPGSIGVDIGCGMAFCETNIPVSLLREQKDTGSGPFIHSLIHSIKRSIPVGFEHRKEPLEEDILPDKALRRIPVVRDEEQAGRYQLGTLGGGNHFIELQENQDGMLCVMIHSGSRNLGYKIAAFFENIAKSNGNFLTASVEAPGIEDLAWLHIDSEDGKNYIACMNWALEFARKNRQHMMNIVEKELYHVCFPFFHNFAFKSFLSVHHNYAALEEHFGEKVWVHRKGAIKVEKGELGIIPGSMGTSSYIVVGKGNPDSYNSASHGAGRRMGRNAFNKTTTKEEADASMVGVFHTGWGKDRKGKPDFSEAPGAYKSIDDVIKAEEDLVEVVQKLKPIGVVKG